MRNLCFIILIFQSVSLYANLNDAKSIQLETNYFESVAEPFVRLIGNGRVLIEIDFTDQKVTITHNPNRCYFGPKFKLCDKEMEKKSTRMPLETIYKNTNEGLAAYAFRLFTASGKQSVDSIIVYDKHREKGLWTLRHIPKNLNSIKANKLKLIKSPGDILRFPVISNLEEAYQLF